VSSSAGFSFWASDQTGSTGCAEIDAENRIAASEPRNRWREITIFHLPVITIRDGASILRRYPDEDAEKKTPHARGLVEVRLRHFIRW